MMASKTNINASVNFKTKFRKTKPIDIRESLAIEWKVRPLQKARAI